MIENHFRSHFSPFQIKTQFLFCFDLFFHKMAAGTFDRIYRHFRSIRNFFCFDFVHKMAAGGHFGLPKITFDRISRHFRSICNLFIFDFVASQNGCCWSFWMTENHF